MRLRLRSSLSIMGQPHPFSATCHSLGSFWFALHFLTWHLALPTVVRSSSYRTTSKALCGKAPGGAPSQENLGWLQVERVRALLLSRCKRI